MAYQKKFNKPYPGGYKDFPDESTIITASVMDNYDKTLEDFDTEFESVDGKLEKLKSAFKFDASGNPTGVEVTGDVVANGVSLVETKEAVSANEANITEINSSLTSVESRVTSVEKKATDNAGEIARVDGRVDELKGDLSYKIGGEEKESITIDANDAPAGLVYLTNKSTNIPSKSYYFYICTFLSESTDYKKQYAFVIGNNTIWSRSYELVNGWSDWSSVVPDSIPDFGVHTALTIDANDAPAGLVYLTNKSTNIPIQSDYYYYVCTIYADGVNYKKQFAFALSDNKLYSRNYNYDGWSEWKDITVKSKGSNVVIVAKMGGDYDTIQDAVNGTTDGATIIVYPGVYEESVNMYGKERYIVGIDKNTCILTNGTGSYYTNPLMCSIGSIENMTVIADTYNSTASIEDATPKPYAIHIENPNADDYTFRINNCILYSKWNPAVGVGVRHNQTVIIENSELKTDCTKSYFGDEVGWKKQGALFAHNDASGSNLGNNGHLIVKNSILHGANCGLSLQPVENNNVLTIDFINATIYDDENGVSDATIYQVTGTPTEGYISGSVIKLGILSHGNIQDRLNAN